MMVDDITQGACAEFLDKYFPPTLEDFEEKKI